MWWYNKVFMRFGLRTQTPLDVSPGMIPTEFVDEILLICRRTDRIQA